MAGRVGLGPVFAFEWRMASRRWQAYAMRSMTVILLFAAMTVVWYEAGDTSRALTIDEQAEVGRAFYGATVIILLGLIGLAAPAATAGAICIDKARGNLTLLFATDLSDAEIVLGKLAARLAPVLGLIFCATPVLSIATLFGGIDPTGVIGAVFVVLACAIFGCSLALTLSIWGRKTHEVLMTTYVFGILYLLTPPIAAALQNGLPRGWWPQGFPGFVDLLPYHPIYLVLAALEGPAPGLQPVTLWTQTRFLILGLSVSALLIGVSIWRIRGVVLGQLGRGELASRRREPRWSLDSIDPMWLGRRGRRLLWLYQLYRKLVPRPSLDRNPVLWRECQRRRPSRWTQAVVATYILFCGGFSLYAIVLMCLGQYAGRGIGMVVNTIQVASGLLLLSVSAATSLAEERQRGSLDILMATPLPTHTIVWGKWWGSFRAVPRLLILPTMLTFALSLHSGHIWGVVLMDALILAYGATITSLGLALATWMPRLGRAVGTTVGLYTMVCLGWIPLAMIVFGDGINEHGIGVAAGSPIMGVGVYSAMLGDVEPGPDVARQTVWMIFWVLSYTGLALFLLYATLSTFNWCLGRVDDPPFAPHLPSPRRGEALSAGQLRGVGHTTRLTATGPLEIEP